MGTGRRKTGRRSDLAMTAFFVPELTQGITVHVENEFPTPLGSPLMAWFRNGDRHLAGVHFLRPNRYSARSQSPFLNQAPRMAQD